MKINILDERLKGDIFPYYATLGSAGMDLYACCESLIVLRPGEVQRVSAGFAIRLDEGYCAMILPRSGLGTRGLVLANTVGLIDSDYIGTIEMALVNYSEDYIVVRPMDKVAQMVILPFSVPEFEFVRELDNTERGSGGFGSTDKRKGFYRPVKNNGTPV